MKRLLSFVLIFVLILSLAACKAPHSAVVDPTEAPASPTAVPTEAPKALRLSEMSEEDCLATLRAFGAEIPEGKETGIMAMVMDFEENIDRPYPGDILFDDEYSLFESVRAAVRAYYISIGAALEPAPTEQPTPEPTAVPWPEEPEVKPAQVIQGKDVFFLVQPDGALYAWGNNEHGQLGIGSDTDRSLPAFVGTGLMPVFVSDTVFALSSDNILWGWGRNDAGQLGTGDREDRDRPVELMYFVKDLVYTWDGFWALTEAGEVYHWGYDPNYSQLTDAEKEARLEPQLEFEDVECIASYCMIMKNGDLYLKRGDWMKVAENAVRVFDKGGYLSYFECADGMLYYINDQNELVPVCGDIKDVQVSDRCAYILKTDGTLWSYSQMGDYHNVPEDQLNTLVFVMDGVREIRCDWEMDEDWGYNYNFALKENGELWAWSMLYSNELVGKPRDNQSTEPSCVAEGVRSFVTNNAQTFIVKWDGSCWATGLGCDGDGGGFMFGGIGDGTGETRYGFVELPLEGICAVYSKLTEKYIDYDDGTDGVELYARTFAVDKEGRIWAWGWNGDGLLGVNAADEEVLTPTEIFLTKAIEG